MILISQGIPDPVLFVLGIGAIMVFLLLTVPQLIIYRFGVLLIPLFLLSVGLFAFAFHEYANRSSESAAIFNGLLTIAASIVLFSAVYLINGLKKKEKAVEGEQEP